MTKRGGRRRTGRKRKTNDEERRKKNRKDFVCWLVAYRPSNRLATGVPILKSGMTTPKKSRASGIQPGTYRSRGALTTSQRGEIEAADQTFHLTQSQYTDTGPTSPSADPVTPGAWQGSHWSANFEVTGMTRPRKNPGASGIRTRDLPLSRRTP